MSNNMPSVQTVTSELKPQQAIFVKKIAQGISATDAAKLANYSPDTAYATASRLLKNVKIIAALERLGLTDNSLAKELKYHIKAGRGVKETAETSLRAMELAFRLKGHLDKPDVVNNTQTNINLELKSMSVDDIQTKLDTILQDIDSLKSK